MPLATIDSEGTEIFYRDTGAVQGSSDYTTLVIYHGSAFTGHNFDRLFPYGGRDNVRVVIINRRDYPPSSLYSEAELEDMNQGRKVALEVISRDTANFLLWFATTQKIPRISTDRRAGGFALMGWSLGSATPVALFGHPQSVPKETFTQLEAYVRQLILFDPAYATFGYESPPGYTPFTDTELDPPDIFQHFPEWVSGYYTHPGLPSRDVSQLDFSRRGSCPSVATMTAVEFAKACYPPAGRSEFPMFYSMQPELAKQGERALFDEETVSTVLPGTEVVWQYCERTNWPCIFAFIETERRWKECIAQGKRIRKIQFQEIKDVNHFVQWDHPARYWAATCQAIHCNL
ncbi:hypothetical protein OE88DRAFT_1680018 [Heliocybe sulcata]|uniref:AB hydrolase-1 domain-containing protein n=1 Tax=Heliocybe sulcata TaxID=5364 RepID=A0A5C3N103_9AGAM|nr:hypothetical protein OE88DRAFT_1680018 [Heliocybe sulcata]